MQQPRNLNRFPKSFTCIPVFLYAFCDYEIPTMLSLTIAVGEIFTLFIICMKNVNNHKGTQANVQHA